MKSATVQGVAGATYLGPGDSGTLHFESASDYYFGINGQLRLPKGFAINAGLLYDQESDRIFNNTYTEQYDPNISTYIGVEYSIIPNRIVAGIKYAHIFVGDTTQSFAGPPNLNVININASTITEVWTSQKTDIYSAHVRWLF